MDYLVNHLGMDVDQPDGRGETPVMYAAKVGGIEALECLFCLGADVKMVDAHGRNVLFHIKSVRSDSPTKNNTFYEKAIAWLLSEGVDIDHTDKYGLTRNKLYSQQESGKIYFNLLRHFYVVA